MDSFFLKAYDLMENNFAHNLIQINPCIARLLILDIT